MIPFRKTYSRHIHGPVNWFPAFAVIMIILNVVFLVGGTFLVYDDTSTEQETINNYFGSGYREISANTDADIIHIILLEDTKGELYYVGFEAMKLIDRYSLITDHPVPVIADGESTYRIHCLAGSTNFSISEDNEIVSGVTHEHMNVVQRYLTTAVLLFAIEFTLYFIIKAVCKKKR